MTPKITISVTIVLFQEDRATLLKTITSFLEVPLLKKVFLIDNSPTDNLKDIIKHPDVVYHFVNKNLGFGAGHNFVLNKIKFFSDFHLVLNPDVSFEKNIISDLISELKKHDDVALIAPKVLFPNKEHQYTARKYPKFFDLIIRRLRIFKKRIFEQEYRNKDLNEPFFAEYITGCFQLYKTKDFITLKGFDQRYFLYMEDVDICKKIDKIGKKKLYYPKVSITHILKKGSSKQFKLFVYHLISAVKYFGKWS